MNKEELDTVASDIWDKHGQAALRVPGNRKIIHDEMIDSGCSEDDFETYHMEVFQLLLELRRREQHAPAHR